jgi:hypothetical protein
MMPFTSQALLGKDVPVVTFQALVHEIPSVEVDMRGEAVLRIAVVAGSGLHEHRLTMTYLSPKTMVKVMRDVKIMMTRIENRLHLSSSFMRLARSWVLYS